MENIAQDFWKFTNAISKGPIWINTLSITGWKIDNLNGDRILIYFGNQQVMVERDEDFIKLFEES